MYCPQCSQEQVSDEMRFCSRCGFPLAIVTQLVRNGGKLAGFEPEAKGQLSPRQKGVRWGIILLIISVVITPLSALMTAMKSDFFVLFIPVFLIFVIGLVRLLHAYLLAPKTATENANPPAAKTRSLSGAYQSALPAGQTIPVTNWRQPVNTSEMAQPLSVTDHTTKLLNDENEVDQARWIEYIDANERVRLKGEGTYFRIRIGEYRVGLKIEADTVTFVRVLNRKDIYKYFP